MNGTDSAGPIKSLGSICLAFSIMVLNFSFCFLESMVIEFMLSGFDVFTIHLHYQTHSSYYLYLMCFVDSEIETNTSKIRYMDRL